ncbi:DUF975 family protein [Mobilibacterium timonense]|uniref:hypothetical protein n=1 Tax=Mobilibacterium timonense TaxID=1871012 RepID=UPI000986ADB8|nr:hypothetical protein [Mobilibacterium timonense]
MNNRYIVREPNGLIRVLTQRHLDGHMANYFLGIFIFMLLDEWIPNILGVFIPRSYFDVLGYTQNMPADVIQNLPRLPFVMLVYAVLMGGVLVMGRCIYTLYFLRNRSVSLPSLFDGFQFYLKALGLYFIQVLIISAMTMLFIFPGVIAYFMFSQSFFILADDPSKGIFQILAESRLRMAGNKMKLFSFDMTYLLLIMLCLIPSYAIQYYSGFDSSTLLWTVIYLVLRLPMVYAMGQLYLGQTVFYELLITGGFRRFEYRGESTFRDAFDQAPNMSGYPFGMGRQDQGQSGYYGGVQSDRNEQNGQTTQDVNYEQQPYRDTQPDDKAAGNENAGTEDTEKTGYTEAKDPVSAENSSPADADSCADESVTENYQVDETADAGQPVEDVDGSVDEVSQGDLDDPFGDEDDDGFQN